MVREMDFVDECYAGKDLSLLKKLTLVIPTYNRNYYLSRCLWYHAHFPFGQIIVADSSPEEKKVVNRDTVEKIREMFGADILYLEYEPETEKYGGDIYRKWGDAVMHVETEYSLICIDKSFVNCAHILQKLEFLSLNKDYASAQGVWYIIERDNSGKYVTHYPRDYRPPSEINHDDAVSRYIYSVGSTVGASFNNQLFSLFRTETHKHIYMPILNGNIKDIRYGEIALSLLPLINGKHKHYPEHMDLIRDISMVETSNGRDKNQSSNLRYPSRYTYANHGVLDEFYGGFEDSILIQFHQAGITDSDKDICDTTRKSYYDSVKNQEFNIVKIVYRNKWAFELWNRIPFKLKQVIFRRLNYHFDTNKSVENEFTSLIKEILVQYPQNGEDRSIVYLS